LSDGKVIYRIGPRSDLKAASGLSRLLPDLLDVLGPELEPALGAVHLGADEVLEHDLRKRATTALGFFSTGISDNVPDRFLQQTGSNTATIMYKA
jgi:hypothetical protein